MQTKNKDPYPVRLTSVRIEGIPIILKNRFKAICAEGNMSMREALILYMKETVNNDHRNSSADA